ncbi:MAG: outer membrane protein assembly factor BamE [Acetobacteraceae bacterium]|nr:outer membrane protein assembly factor BamE [Acetobacteraceae bacterium]
MIPPFPSPSFRFRRVAAAASLLLALAGCSFFEAKSQVRGNKIDPDALAELTPGTSTRADATALLGSPTARATFDDNSWIYINETTRPRIGRTPGILDQRVVVLRFSEAGVLQEVRRLNEDDSMPVSVVARATPSPGNDTSLLGELFGNIGRFSPGGSTGGLGGLGGIGGGEAPSGGAPTP